MNYKTVFSHKRNVMTKFNLANKQELQKFANLFGKKKEVNQTVTCLCIKKGWLRNASAFYIMLIRIYGPQGDNQKKTDDKD